MKRGAPLRRLTPLARKTPLRRSSLDRAKRPRHRATGPKVSVRDLVFERDHHVCVACGMPSGLTIQHRVNRGQGGGKAAWRNAPSNLLTLCARDNTDLETDPEKAETGRSRGWKLRAWEDPREIPVVYVDGLFLLDDNGRRKPAKENDMARALARRDSPDTSWEAAASVGDTSNVATRVLALLLEHPEGGTDEQLARWHWAKEAGMECWPRCSAQSIRSRRAELVRDGYVRAASEDGHTATGRRSTVWAATRMPEASTTSRRQVEGGER